MAQTSRSDPATGGAVPTQSNRDMLSRGLQRQGHSVTAAENGRKALDLVAESDFDLVLLDIMMPELDGYQVLERLKSDPGSRDIPRHHALLAGRNR